MASTRLTDHTSLKKQRLKTIRKKSTILLHPFSAAPFFAVSASALRIYSSDLSNDSWRDLSPWQISDNCNC